MSLNSHVLIVDDEPSTLLIIKDSLQGLCNVLATSSPIEALALAEKHSPVLILLDVEMPQVNGFDLCKRLKTHSATANAGIVFITAHCDSNIEKAALSMGAIDFIAKPVNQELCRLRISNHLQALTQQHALRVSNEALLQEKNRLSITLESVGDAVITTNENLTIDFMNRAAQRMTGWPSKDAIGMPIDEVMITKDAITGNNLSNPLHLALQQKRSVGLTLNTQLCSRHGDIFRIEDNASPVLDSQGGVAGGVIVFQDITDAVALATQMTHLANHDQLTGLPNRRLFHDHMSQAIENANSANTNIAVFVIDIDNFKYLNDLLGHSVGDSIIKHVARHIETATAGNGILSRVGGDEFALLIDGISNIASLNLLANAILATAKVPFIYNNEEHYFSLSIGISVYPLDAASPDNLLQNADAAMYKVKAHGKNNFWFYSEHLLEELKDRVDIEKQLYQAIHNNGLVVHYQPKVDLLTGNFIGAEALVRLQGQDKNLIYPDAFISVAEETGLITKLGVQMLQKSCQQAKAWLDDGKPLKVAVNIAAQHFTEADFVTVVQKTLNETRLPPAYLELEITESALMINVEAAQNTITQLNKIGVSIALDDFGTGYSSLSYLRTFKLDVLKIDRSFLKDAVENLQARSVVKAIVNLAEMLQLELVCEGIESQQHLELMLSLGCYEGQGYLFSKPVDIESFNTQKISHYLLQNDSRKTV